MPDPTITNESITVTIDNPGRGNPLTQEDFSFDAGALCIHLHPTDPPDEIHFLLSGNWNNGSAIPANKLRFGAPGHQPGKGDSPDDINGIMWYHVATTQPGNGWMTSGQVQAINTWIDQNQPQVDSSDADGRTYTVTIDPADVQRFSPGGNTIHLYYRIFILARKHHEDEWYGAVEDPEVDIDMDD